MYGFFFRLGTWLLHKVGAAVLIVVLALLGVGLWLFARDQVDAETRRLQYVAQLQSQHAALVAAQADALAMVESLRDSARLQQERIERADRIIATLTDLQSWWEHWFGDAEQQKLNADQIVRMQALKTEAGNQLEVVQRELQGAMRDAAEVEFRVSSLQQDLEGSENSRSATAHYFRAAWSTSRDYLVVALLLFFLGPTVVKVLAFYLIAPWFSRGKPIRLEESQVAMPHVRPSQVSAEIALWPGEVLRVKERFLQTSDEGLLKKTLMVLDWAIPFTSVACRLTELVELRNGHAGDRATLTLSNPDDPHIELAVVEVPEGGSIVMRPSFLVGVITRGEDKVEIRRRWTLWRWQAWITLQFRFFEFVGPCRLVVAGSRGIRAEEIIEREGIVRSARRTNQRATIGFTPNLDYLPVRAETFWGYYRGMNPLFDDLFAGTGVFVLQETATDSEKSGPQRFWETVWNSVLKVFGI